MPKEFPSELLNKYYARGADLCVSEIPIFCYCGLPSTISHIAHCRTFAAKVKSKCKELAKAAGEVW